MKAKRINQSVRDEYLVAVCDENLLGKQLTEHVKISEHFYKEKLVGKEEVLKELEKATLANIFGNEIVKITLEEGVVDEENVKEIAGIKHAIIMCI
jgi:hypothetical protein